MTVINTWFVDRAVSGGDPWVDTFTPSAAGNALVFCIIETNNRTLIDIQLDGGETLNQLFSDTAPNGYNMYGYEVVGGLQNGGLKTLTIDWSGNAFGMVSLMETENGTAAFATAAQAVSSTDHSHASPGITTTNATALTNIHASGNAGFNDMPGWTREFAGLPATRDGWYAGHTRAAYSPSDDTIPITCATNRTSIGSVIYVTGAAPSGPTQNIQTPDQDGVFGSIGSYDASGDWTTSGGPLTFSNVQNGPVGLSITPSGILQWTNNMVVGTYAGVTYDCTDDNGTTTSNTFTFTQSAAPPTEDTPPPSPKVNAGFTGTVADVSANYSLGAGGTGPLQYFASSAGTAWPGWLSIDQNTGVITATSAVSTVAGLQIRVEDSTADPGAAVNDSGTPFQVEVLGGGTLTTPPLKDHTGALLTGQTGYSVKAVDATATGTPVVVYAAANIAQEANGTIEIADAAFTIGDWYYLDGSIPDADPATNKNVTMYRFHFLLQAT